MRTCGKIRTTYALLLTVVVLAAWFAGCQPKEERGGLPPGHSIGETAEATLGPAEAATRAASTTETAPSADKVTEPAAGEDISPAGPAATDDAPASQPDVSEDEAKTQPPPAAQDKPDDDNAKETAAEPAIESTPPAEVAPPADSMNATPAETENAPEVEPDKTSDLELIGPRIYAGYKDLLGKYVDARGNVDYATLRRKRGELYAIVRDLDSVDPREYLPWGRNEKIAFWLNAYNIFTLKVVIDNYPIESSWAKVMLNYPKNSIVHISDPWTKKYFKVMGIEYTLREIEREILLGRFQDPRVCLALSYASMGGAMLRNEPYHPDKLDEQLDDQARKFLADPRGFEVNAAARTVTLADIFNWYKQNFIAKYGDIRKFRDKPPHIQAYLNFIVTYIDANHVRFLETQEYTVEFRKYDWRLNEQPNK